MSTTLTKSHTDQLVLAAIELWSTFREQARFDFDWRILGDTYVTIRPSFSVGYFSAGDDYVLSALHCCDVCSCGYAPFLCPCHKTETSPFLSCPLGDHFLAHVCVSLQRFRMSCGLCPSPFPALCPVLFPLSPECGTVTESGFASSCGHYCCCCDVR